VEIIKISDLKGRKIQMSDLIYHISALGHQGTHPTPLEAMQRLRVLLLGKGDLIEVQNPSVQLEPESSSDISPGEAAELLERQKSIEEEVIVSKNITSDIDTIDEDQTAHLESLHELDVIYMTQKEIDEKMNSNSFQVRIDTFGGPC
jgi:hypothetical protein